MYMFLIVVFAFVFGLLAGSFLNAVIYRLPSPALRQAGLRSAGSVVRGRSHCPKCGKILSWYELLPVISFLIQRGRCRGCKKNISFQYPLVELATGILFALVIFNYQFSLLRQGFGGQAIINEFSIFNFQFLISLAIMWAVMSGLIVIFVYDLRHYIIPDKILFPLILVALFAKTFNFWIVDYWKLIENWSLKIVNFELLISALLVGVLTALPFALLHFASRGRWMGFGDVKFAFFMGVLLGWPNILLALFLGFNLGAIAGIALILAGKKKLKNQIPFAPFLILGTLTTLFWGGAIIRWYFDLLF
ncbi:MAG: prepilin peptidase [Candidatus Spechtbacteria bacterium]|nr:prepilin peptidase [Candidatus Spechtbacteria bacterium]